MDPALAEVVSSIATALAATAVFAALFAAVVDTSDPHKAEVPPAVPYLAALGIIIFLAGRVLRYHFAGY
jgi:hypothetical protein